MILTYLDIGLFDNGLQSVASVVSIVLVWLKVQENVSASSTFVSCVYLTVCIPFIKEQVWHMKWVPRSVTSDLIER